MEVGERADRGAPELEQTLTPEDRLELEQLLNAGVLTDQEIFREGLTFGDVLLVPERTDLQPGEAEYSTRLVNGIELKIPFVSAAMDTVTEASLAIALAREGGVGVLHAKLTAEQQAEQIERVKRSESAFIPDPECLSPTNSVEDVRRIRKEKGIGSVLITEGPDQKLVGIVTKRQLRSNPADETRISEIMKPVSEFPTLRQGATRKAAEDYFSVEDVDCDLLPVTDAEGRLKGLYTYKDVWLRSQFPNAAKDAEGRLRVGAAISVNPEALERVRIVKEAGTDFVVVDMAHGHNDQVIDLVREIKRQHPDLPVIAGNIATAEAALDLLRAGADALKVGFGPGASCDTREKTGYGEAQLKAIRVVRRTVDLIQKDLPPEERTPVIADGGIASSGDMVKALAAGADTVMMGRMFAGVTESPSEEIVLGGRLYKKYRGMGSKEVMKETGGDRYYGTAEGMQAVRRISQGVSGRVAHEGPLARVVEKMLGAVDQGFFFSGSRTLKEFQGKSRFARMSAAAQAESRPHDMTVTEDSADYPV